MMRKVLLSVLFLLLGGNTISKGQGFSNIWMGGYSNSSGTIPYGGWMMDFNLGSPVISHDLRAMNFDFTCATIADSIGNFLFATNGVIIMNSSGDTMQNGAGLNPSVYSSPLWFADGLRLQQAALIVPLPGSNSIYYLFHLTVDSISIPLTSNYFYYSVIDMTLDNGNGAVILKNQVLNNGYFAPTGIAGCKHANGRDWWINIHGRNSAEVHFFLLTPLGVTFSHTQSIGFRDGNGTYSFSPDGKRFGGYWKFRAYRPLLFASN